MESTRVIMLRNWHFDILNSEHWRIAWDLWLNSWVISEPKEWAFVLIIISFIPLWFTGWIALSLVSWGKMIWFVLTLPWKLFKNFFYRPVKIITTSTGVTPIRRRKSYKEIRPRPLRPIAGEQTEAAPVVAPIVIPTVTPISRRAPAPRSAAPQEPKTFDHALFKFDDNFDDLDFDIDSFDVEKPSAPEEKAPEPRRQPRETSREASDRDNRRESRNDRDNRRSNDVERKPRRDERDNRREERNEPRERANDKHREDPRNDRNKERAQPAAAPTAPKENAPTTVAPRPAGGSCLDIIKQKGYEVISRVSIKNILIDFVGVSDDKICLCMLDREPGDWLADEERFNDEEPLWFSESSHRISPVRKIDIAKRQLLEKLAENDFNFAVEAYVVEQIGNIINAEDMFEIWDDMGVNVTRIDRGTPREIKLFARALPEAEKHIAGGKLDKLMKLIRNIG